MADQVLAVQKGGIPIGVIDKALSIAQELVGVTFQDALGAVHSVHVHKDGPFQTVEEILAAFYDGTIHANPAEAPPAPAGEGEAPPAGSSTERRWPL